MKRLLIIAGSGMLPYYVAKAARLKNDEPVIASILNECSFDWKGFECQELPLGDFCVLRSILLQYNIGRIVVAGAISIRPSVRDLCFSIKDSFRISKMIWQLVSGGDASLLNSIINFLESYGVSVIGAHEIIPDLLAEKGSLGICVPSKDSRRDIFVAMKSAEALSELEIGQSAISIGGRVVALEGVEGTDYMLQRIVDCRDNGKIIPGMSGVLVKMCKSQQDMRADLPSIGEKTVQNVIRAGLSGIALEAGKSLILEKELVKKHSDEKGIFVIGIDREFSI
ncbi:LpxI family protein [Candidatus Liberibacter brunswickensis]|uniref:LpxI family protein n=1 Tax=Candidatus Liberibacter brunswickensis TaxID=1968796 RepID=UPI002FDFDC39